ncbi:hypothetical protein B4589_010245 [Halolamina sp. CBA1230]|uniref:hypothetical protein n=1 Tax=Halolamina sp. CBA1230 TaxID=1853690 RepID=UPI0009A17999|nr:hypothetical protein [Halolamina sp. CBA1230]QKY20740.1 hypothetical protein B4589_010245 [Halolamina sp. CBA1230]
MLSLWQHGVGVSSTGLERQRVNDALNALENAGWIEKPARGLYRLVYDGEGKVEQEIRHVDDV